MRIEQLEDRKLLAGDLSISDATAVELSSTMKFIDSFIAPQSGALLNARGIDFGPDGNLYVSGEADNGTLGYVNRYDSATGRFIDRFASHPSMTGAKDVEFGPDGNLYVPNNFGHNVYRFNGTTGAFMDVFIASGSGGLTVPRSLIFGPDGSAYVTSAATDNVLRYDGVTGEFIDSFVTPGSGGLNDPTALVFGPDGDLFVGSGAHSDYYNSILRYNGTTGVFKGVFVTAGSAGLTLAPTAGVIFGPDVNNDTVQDLYVSNGVVDEVLIYSGANGSHLQKFITPGLGGLKDPKGLLFDSDGNLLVVNNGDHSVLRFGAASKAAFTVSLSQPSTATVTVEYSTSNGTAIAGTHYSATSGTVTFFPGDTSRTIIVPTLLAPAIEPTTTFLVSLSNPSGALIADSQGIATILDSTTTPPTKFYVVNDGSPDQTYEYGASGTAIENYAIQSTNTSPRGAASTAAGDKVWVADANKKVYVYDNSGTSLGSGWSAGSLQSSWIAGLQGITTNGADVWLVEDTFSSNKNDKIYRYNNAASRVLGSQNMSSSFSLNSANRNPTDLVTDGSSIWVLNNTSTTDSVFKYTVSGSFLGSWTITSGGGNPTGLTIDPTVINGNIWVVDNNTDRVYQFDSATTRTGGSASPSSSFKLAAGNTNPQGIADPPPPASMLASQGTRVASGTSMPEVEKPNRKVLTSSDPFIAHVDSIFENWNESSESSQTKKRLAGRR